MEVKNQAYILGDDFFLVCRAFSDSMLSSFSSFKKLITCPYGWFPLSRDTYQRHCFRLCASSFPQLWFRVARLQQQYCFKALIIPLAHHPLWWGWELSWIKNQTGGKFTCVYSAIISLILQTVVLTWLKGLHMSKQGRARWHKLLQRTLSLTKPCLCWALLPSSKLFNTGFEYIAVKCFAGCLGKTGRCWSSACFKGAKDENEMKEQRWDMGRMWRELIDIRVWMMLIL